MHVNVCPPGLSSASDAFMTFMLLKTPLSRCPDLLILVETGHLFLLASVLLVESMNSGSSLPQGWHEYGKMVTFFFFYQNYIYKAYSHPRYIPTWVRRSWFPLINGNICFILVHPQDGNVCASFSILSALSSIHCYSVFVVVVRIRSCSRPQFLQFLENMAGGKVGL